MKAVAPGTGRERACSEVLADVLKVLSRMAPQECSAQAGRGVKCCGGDAGEEYRVRLFDGSEKTVKDGSLAMNFKEGDSVLYTSPKGGQSIPGTIIASNGNFW